MCDLLTELHLLLPAQWAVFLLFLGAGSSQGDFVVWWGPVAATTAAVELVTGHCRENAATDVALTTKHLQLHEEPLHLEEIPFKIF